MANEDNAAQNALATTPDAADQGGNPGETQSETNAVELVEETPADSATETVSETQAAPETETAATPEVEAAPAPAAPSDFAPTPQRVNQAELSDSLSPVGNISDEPRKEVEDGRTYEIIFIVRPNQGEAVEKINAGVREHIEGGAGAVDNIRVSEARRLAYPIAKEIEGIYVVVNARFSKDLTLDLDRFFKLEENVIRHMVLRQED